MATVPVNLTSLLSQLNTSGLSQKDQPLYQVIRQLILFLRQTQIALEGQISDIPSGGSGITQLTGDVLAGPGTGSVAATIAPNVVTYSKIQQVTGLRLVGNPDASTADMVEIPLGDNIAFLDGALVVEVTPGVPGLLHRLLSATHYDTVAAVPVFGDIIRAVEGPDFEGLYYGFTMNSPVVEDFTGIRFGYTRTPDVFTGNYFAYYPPALDVVEVTPPNSWLAWEYIDFYMLSLLVEDFTGIRFGYEKVFNYLTGNNFAYYPPELDFIVPPSPENEDVEAVWERMEIGTDDQVLTVVDGAPEWATPTPPVVYPIVHPWVEIPFDAADFTATGGSSPTWTVIEANVVRWEYQYYESEDNDENSVRIALYVRDTTVGGTAPTQLLIELPFNLLGGWGSIISLQENLVSVTDAFVAYGSPIASNFLAIQKIPFGGSGPAFDTTATGTFLSFEISARLQP
jgi:hypothetical protein